MIQPTANDTSDFLQGCILIEYWILSRNPTKIYKTDFNTTRNSYLLSKDLKYLSSTPVYVIFSMEAFSLLEEIPIGLG